MRLEGVVTSVNYADFLSDSLPLNLRHFDDLVVVTAPEDVETQRIARYYGARLVLTDNFRTRWNEMHKAKGINAGLAQLGLGDWVIHFDADMVLPPQTRALIERADLDKTLLYGCDRFIVPGYDAWRLHQAMPPLQQDNYHVHMDMFTIAPRFAGERMGGYSPPGFFQMWHPSTTGHHSYPEEHTSAAKTDVLFTANWWRRGRALIPEFVAYHLESEAAAQGTNWGGRVTTRWGPEPDRHDHHHPRHHHSPPHHHHPPPPDPYEPDRHHHHHHHHDRGGFTRA